MSTDTIESLREQVRELERANENLGRELVDADEENAELAAENERLEDLNESAEHALRILEDAATPAANARITAVDANGAWWRVTVEMDDAGANLDLREGAAVRIMVQR